MKKPTPPPCRLAELYESVLDSLRGMDEDRRLSVIRALAGGLDDPEYRPWEYYFPRGVVVCSAQCASDHGQADTLHDEGHNALDLQSSRCSFESE